MHMRGALQITWSNLHGIDGEMGLQRGDELRIPESHSKSAA